MASLALAALFALADAHTPFQNEPTSDAFATLATETSNCHGGCRVDAFCNASKHAFAAARRHGRPRVAVLLRGVSFRNWGGRDTEGSCCNGTEAPQLLAVRSWRGRLFEPLEARGYEVDAFAATYRCSNGRGLVEETLLPALAPRLRSSYVGSEANTSQLSTLGRVLGLAFLEGTSRADTDFHAAHERLYEHVFVVRIDMMLTDFDLECLLASDAPATKAANADQFAYFPGRYFECAVRHRYGNSEGHEWMKTLVTLSGDYDRFEAGERAVNFEDHQRWPQNERRACHPEMAKMSAEKTYLDMRRCKLAGRACPDEEMGAIERECKIERVHWQGLPH